MSIQVTMSELRDIWSAPDAVSLTVDERRGVKIVRMDDGTEYSAPLDGPQS